MEEEMEKVKNIIIMIIQNLKENIQMEKDNNKEENILLKINYII